MFKYQSLYKNNGRGQHMKTFWFTVLIFILVYAAAIALTSLVAVPFFALDTAFAVLSAVFIFLLLILAAIFVFYPLSVGILRYFAAAYLGQDFKVKDAFRVFKKGNYSKVIKLGLLSFVAYFVFSLAIGMVLQVLVMAINTPLLASFDPDQTSFMPTAGEIGTIITVVLMNFLVALISYVPYILAAIYFFLVFMAYIDEPLTPTTEKFQMAWSVMFRSGESVLKLIFSNFFLWLLPSILIVLLFIVAVSFTGIYTSTFTFGTFLIGGLGLIFFSYIFTTYFLVGSVVAYYFKGRDHLDEVYRMSRPV